MAKMSVTETLAKMDPAELEALKARLAAAEAENVRLREREASRISLKASEKGAVSLYGLGRFPVTLYPQQWLKVLDMAESIKGFIATNREKLSWK